MMEKKTRKKSKLLTTLTIIIIVVAIISVIVTLSIHFMNVARYNDNKKYIQEQQEQENIKKSNKVMLYKINNNKYINQYGYIVESSNISAITLQGLTVTASQENIETSLFTKLLTLYNTLENNELLNNVTKIDITDLENIKVYMDSENKTILIGNFESLNTKFLFAKNIITQEKGKQGEIIVKDINKAYFRESL